MGFGPTGEHVHKYVHKYKTSSRNDSIIFLVVIDGGVGAGAGGVGVGGGCLCFGGRSDWKLPFVVEVSWSIRSCTKLLYAALRDYASMHGWERPTIMITAAAVSPRMF